MPLQIGFEETCVAKYLTPFADLKKAHVSESLCKECAAEVLHVIWKYGKQNLSQEMLLGEEA
jgi:hypothetical protein